LRAVGHGARIINIASTAGLTGYAYVSAYCAAKHGVIGLTRALALELAKTPITVNAVCPGYTDTPMVRQSVALIGEKTGRAEATVLADLAKTNPQGRLITPEEVADTVVFLASPGAASITGQAIAISGGGVMAG
jgi:NAD(P)-dependent dehydrogenase (short-subunit alcohol dehydrogenase family)